MCNFAPALNKYKSFVDYFPLCQVFRNNNAANIIGVWRSWLASEILKLSVPNRNWKSILYENHYFV